MTTKTLPSGPLKLIFADSSATAANQQRALAGSKSFKPMFYVLVLNDDGEVVEQCRANVEPQEVTLCYDPLSGADRLYPAVAKLLRRAKVERVPGFWCETKNALTLTLTLSATDDSVRADA